MEVTEERFDRKPRLAELDFHKDNVKTLIKTSNVTPVRYKNGDKYGCSYCRREFLNPRDLKSHSIEKHKDGKPSCFKIKLLSKFITFLDITSLKCKMCLTKMNNVQDLIDHLKDVHQETIHPNIKTQIVPFKFEDGEIKCGVCELVCKEFDLLEAHVATHFRNYVCQFCETAFIVKHKMVEHKKNVHQV
ncbi:transcriptional repressor CTCFL [Amyelois transitella]|uniref:transcriptional repressor CTCFL n=1 Tax=Amyelois transitella TaxID=680683 RepID=UPI00298FE662|nr:transcriptional repressor CTCFL [Amyelois transitella]